ncbi:MAG: hypothetical protein JJU21_08960 [Salinarimonas sp.]|nr:hypothetical protein [Salinarimonas sp.]
MSEAPGGIGAVSGAGEKVVLARSDHTLRLVNALDHARQALRAPPSGDFSATMGEKLAQKPTDQAEASADATSASGNDDAQAPRLDFMRTSILRGHLSQPGTFNPDPNAAPLPELPRERDAAQGPAPDIMRADEIAALSAMLDAERGTTARPSLEALAGAEANHLPPDVLQDLHNRHLAREAQGNAANGWPAPDPP